MSSTGTRTPRRRSPGPRTSTGSTRSRSTAGTARRTGTRSSSTGTGRAGTRAGAGSNRAAAPRRPAGRERFEARRLAVERRAGIRRLQLVVGLAVVASLAVGCIAFINSSWFDVDEVAVVGAERADPDEIVEASGILLGDGLLEVDLDGSARAVELVSWVGTAEIARSWDGTVTISVAERGPAAAIEAGDRFALVDDHGRQLEIVDQRPDGFLPVRGIDGSGVPGEVAPPEVLPVIAVLEALPTEVEERISAVVVDGEGLALELVDGGRALLGNGDDLGAKLQAFETMLARVELTCLDTIDVRVPGAPVVTRSAPLGPVDGASGEDADGAVDGEVPVSAPADC